MQSKWIGIGLGGLLSVAPVASAAFNVGDLAVVRINGGVTTTDVAATVSILVYSPQAGGGYTLSNTINLPNSGAGAFTLPTDTVQHDGLLRQSSDGRYLTLAGYQVATGGKTFTATAAAAPRVIARIDGTYAADTGTVMTGSYDQAAVEAAASRDGTGFWVAGSGTIQNEAGSDLGPATNSGLRYVPFGSAASTTTHIDQQRENGAAVTNDNLRSVLIADNQLYFTTASQTTYGNRGLYSVGTGLPTGGTNAVAGRIVNSEGNPGPLDLGGDGKLWPKTDCVLLDLNAAIPGVDTAYSTGGKKEYEKWIKDSNGVWQNVFQKSISISTDINTLTASVNNGQVTLFAATVSGVYQMADAFGYSTNLTPTMSTTPLFTATAGTQQFRGLVALVPEPASLATIGLAGVALLRRKRGSVHTPLRSSPPA